MDAETIALFRELADRTEPEREEYYARHAVRAALRAEVESLLRFDPQTSDSIHRYVVSVAQSLLQVPAPTDASRVIQPPLVSLRTGAEFCGTDRFAVRRRLGAGGMGVVYEVHDQLRDEVVALKTLLRARGDDIYRLKREFRSLTGIAHTNLVSLYELVIDDGNCFFTMELVHGTSFVEYARGSAAAPRALDALRIRRALRQLAEGILALHRRGKLHRDIKPTNILVTADGRVVILDFGLVSDACSTDADWRERMAGTPAYVAPERWAGATPSESQDWYSVGVTLHEALTGRLPLGDSSEPALGGEWKSDLRPPADAAPDVPQDLNAICAGLLRSDPAHRLSGADVFRILDRDVIAQTGAPPSDTDIEPPFVGRRQQFEALEAAFAAARRGRATAVYVHGPPGIGKTALVERFLDDATGREEVVVLRGRCHEHESVPYKALDGVIDSLSRHLAALPRALAEPLLPPDIAALARLFPVLLQVESVAYHPAAEMAEPQLLRERAFAALRDLLVRLSAQQPLIVWIDDLHWADDDSTVLLEELFRPPQPPPILMIVCFRSEEIAARPFLQTVLERAGPAGTVLPLDPMTEDEARVLVSSVISTGTRDDTVLPEVVREARGNPFLLRQLAGYLATRDIAPGRVTFAEAMDDRLRSLPPPAQRFIEALAICGRPMEATLVHRVAGLDGDERPVVAGLRAAQFLRISGSARRVELYHDRIREAIDAGIPTTKRRHLHRLIAGTLIARGADDPEPLFEHFRAADEVAEASRYAVLAAKKADAALAFDRAAGYYKAALELTPEAADHREWAQRRAAALAHAGRPAVAADAYLKAADEVDATRSVELQRLSAEQLLIGGHVDRGLEVIRAVLRALGMRLTRTPRTALASFLWRRALLRWRGLTFVERSADRIRTAELLRMDTCWSVACGLALVDTTRAADFHTRHLLLALDGGEPYRIARAFALDTAIVGAAGGRYRQQALDCAARAETMAQRVGHPHVIGLCALARGSAMFAVGDWPAAEHCCDQALRVLRDHSAGTIWELNAAQLLRLGALLYQGRLRNVSREVPMLVAAAHERGNLYLETELRTRMNLMWLVADAPEEGERQANEAIGCWSEAGFHRQHYNHVVARVQTELYRRHALAAWRTIAGNWSSLERELLLRIQFQRIEARYLRARCALLMAATGHNARHFRSRARRDASSIARENMPWSDPLSSLLTAGVAYLEGNLSAACGKLTEAAAGFDRAHMNLYAAVARRRLGELAADEDSQERRRQADAWMTSEGIVNASRITRLIAPGFPDIDR